MCNHINYLANNLHAFNDQIFDHKHLEKVLKLKSVEDWSYLNITDCDMIGFKSWGERFDYPFHSHALSEHIEEIEFQKFEQNT